MAFGAWMREVRVQQGRTQSECAETAGMKLQYWNRLEKHVDRPEKETVVAIAAVLKADEDEALHVAGYASTDSEPDVRLARRLDRILRDVSDTAKRRKIEEMLERDAANYVSLVTA